MNESEQQHQIPPEEEQESEQYYDQNESYSPVTMLFGEELKQALLEEFDNIFTKEYITTDPYLLYNMNSEFYAPISVIEDLPQIKALTFDTSMILQALRASDKVIIDEQNNMVKPVCNLTQRNTIIIRDISSSTSKEEIRELFGNNEKFLSAIAEMKYEYGDNYFVKFVNEEITLEALVYLRDRMLRGKPIQARIKSENLRKSFYYNVPQTPYYFNGTTNPYGENPSANGDNRPYKSNQRTHDPKSSKPGRFGGNRRRGEPKVRRGRPPSKKNTPHEKNEHKTHSAFSMSGSHWPPLPVPSASEEGKKLVAGYPGDFTKYQKDQFIQIICALTNNPNPKFETESPAILENGMIHADLEILKPIPNGAVVEFLEAKQKTKGKAHKNPKTESPPSGPAVGPINVPNADSKEPVETTPSPPATVWPAIDSSSVKTPPPPNHQSHKKPPPPKQRQTNKPPTSGPATTSEKPQTPAGQVKPLPAGQKPKDQPLQQQTKTNTKHYPSKQQQHQKKPLHSDPHSPHKQDTSSTKSTDKENPNSGSVTKDSISNLSAAKENQGPASKEKSESISTPSYADIARSTTPTNTPSNSTVSD